MTEEFEVRGHHDHVVEHAAETESLGRWVAMFTAVLATLGAIVSYQNGASESLGLELKNEAILKKSEASDQWAYYQAKGIKEIVVANMPAANPADRERLAAEAKRYADEKAEIQKEARRLDTEAKANDAASVRAVQPHHHLAQALALVQVAIALAALTVLTRQRWLLMVSGLSAAIGVTFWILAWL
jgi:soluble lytic murein transglycosylase-like protein